MSSRRNTARSPKSNKTNFKNSYNMGSQKEEEEVVKLYKKSHRPKNDSIHIDALHALNTCEEEDDTQKKPFFPETGEPSLKTQDKLRDLLNKKSGQRMVIEIDEEKRLKELEKGRSSGELTPNNQIFSAGRH